jgi:hypothetical protein
VFDYVYERDSNYQSENFQPENYGKGVLLDEFYTNNIIDKEDVKKLVTDKYCGNTAQTITFAKPRKKNGIYAIVMNSNRFFYDRFYREIDTFCFWYNCHKPIKGRYAEFPKVNLKNDYCSDGDSKDERFFCSNDCKRKHCDALSPLSEGEFQEKQSGMNGSIYGYIYLIYNKSDNTYYIGQTRFLPFFRWQEHAKSGLKGDIKDLSFSVITEVARNYKQPEDYNQQYLNSIEAWWIEKYKEEGFQVKNISNPKITIDYLQQSFDEMIAKQSQLSLIS